MPRESHQESDADRIRALEKRVAELESVINARVFHIYLPSLPTELTGRELALLVHLGGEPPESESQAGGRATVGTIRPKEYAAWPWKHLVARAHPWRRQLYLKGKNLTVRQLVGAMKANGLSPAEAAADFGLPEEAISEALAYAEKHKALLDYEAGFEQQLLAKRGHGVGSPTLPG
jgi:uncharacterized protein (DUF433 family)